ncbi:MAG: P-II family nitrogen regulator [Tissierellia bacterium]|nr:P-II family nitrogen regulator [Tissierellia bacterium]
MKELLTVIVPRGKGSHIMDLLQKKYQTGSSVCYGEGSIKNNLLCSLCLDQVHKEIVISFINKEKSQEILEELKKDFSKENTAIAFTIGEREMNYKAIYTIVDRKKGDQVISLANKNGATGATIIHGRGSGIEKKSLFIHMKIEPEKDIVLMLVKDEIADHLVKVINEEFELEKENNGIIFTMPVSGVVGIRE